MTEPALINDSQWIILKEILNDRLTELINTFSQDTKNRLRAMRVAVNKSDIAEAKSIIHSVKGASLNLGADALAQMSNLFELQISTGELPASEQLDALDHLFAQTLGAIDELQQN